MQFMVAAYLKPGSEKQLLNFRDDLNEHFAQSNLKVAGRMFDKEGNPVGYLGFVEGESFDDAERFVKQGPFYSEDLYAQLQILRYELEVGQFSD